MFKKILIANRGEIALRIIRACKELGTKTVAVYSEADRDSLHIRFADEEVCIGKPPARESYLNVSRIISAAEITAAEAIHPGYGFLAENPDFAEICETSGIKFIGPSAETIKKMGDKAYARQTMKKAGLPIIPGTDGIVKSWKEGLAIAREIGFPVMIKAAAGGGGKGMRLVEEERNFENGFQMAQAEAQAAFGNGGLYLEKYLLRPRHIEFQLLGDNFGNVIHLGERDCSLQRRHQKLLEESPSPALTPELRQKIGELAVKGAKAVGYESAGTMEFLLDQDKNFYFMEMNTRIQVEHPVTEFVTGLDIVKEQIKIAAREKINPTLIQKEISLRGHAIECRINAEDPEKGFAPFPGKVTSFHLPGGPGVRVDSHVYAEYTIPPYYDSMIAKLITHGKNREEAIARMRRALEECIIEGVKTTIPFHQKVLQDEQFNKGEVDTGFLEKIQKMEITN
ncbi:MAG: acetyl-CoA carboxylase biotin carboxylase subunit [Candidatus Edwardsbacteria bacterium]